MLAGSESGIGPWSGTASGAAGANTLEVSLLCRLFGKKVSSSESDPLEDSKRLAASLPCATLTIGSSSSDSQGSLP